MAFPISPTNGQQANINGITYTYSNTLPAWTVSTSVSNTFVSISVSGNVNSGNILNTGLISATGNVTGNYFVGNGSLLTGISGGGGGGANIANGTSNITIASSGGNATVNIGGTANVVVFATTGEYVTGVISATGDVVGGNVTTTGLISGTGNITGGNVLTTGVLQAPVMVATNGIIVNSNTVSANYSITTGNNGTGAGPVIIANGISVTVVTGSRWVIL